MGIKRGLNVVHMDNGQGNGNAGLALTSKPVSHRLLSYGRHKASILSHRQAARTRHLKVYNKKNIYHVSDSCREDEKRGGNTLPALSGKTTTLLLLMYIVIVDYSMGRI